MQLSLVNEDNQIKRAKKSARGNGRLYSFKATMH